MGIAMRWRLRSLAAEHKVTNRKIAAALAVHETTISKWKNADEMPALSQRQIETLAKVIGCSEAELLGLGD